MPSSTEQVSVLVLLGAAGHYGGDWLRGEPAPSGADDLISRYGRDCLLPSLPDGVQ